MPTTSAPEPSVGLDLGLAALVTLSTGEKVEAPQHLRHAAKRLAKAERAKARKRKGSVHDAGWGELRRQIAYKAGWAGRRVVLHPRFARSTGVCPECGHVEPKLELKVRRWTCGGCGATHDRDVAAARIVERHAITVGAARPEPDLRVEKRASAGLRRRGPRPRRSPGPAANVPRATLPCLQAV